MFAAPIFGRELAVFGALMLDEVRSCQGTFDTVTQSADAFVDVADVLAAQVLA